jgi:hypothetical protein
MALDVLVRLKDNLSGPLKRLMGLFKQMGSLARSIGLLGASVAAISFMGPIKEAAAFQQKLLDIAGTAELSGKAAFQFVDVAKSQFESLALATGQYSDTIAAGAGKMIAAGLDRGLVDASIGDISKAATAANAEFNDMADVATTLMQTLNVPADQLKDSLGALVVAGKLGSFELKDMARYFPTLTSQMAKFGVTGREAVNFLGSALQIARKGTADPAEAANNLKNFLSKILMPATIKNFKDAGVDIEGVMRDAAVKGINPIEAVLQKITKLTGVSGDEIAGLLQKAKKNGLEGKAALEQVREQLVKIHGAGALGEIFSDQQVMDFLIPFLGNVDEYKRIKEAVAKATGAAVDTDFETQMQGLNRQLTIFQEIGTQAAREVGFAFGAWLPMINDYLAAGLKSYRAWDKETGGLGTKLLTAAGGGVLLATAFGALGIALPIIGAGLSAVAALISPLGVLLAGLGFAATHIYKNWSSYGPKLARVWDTAKRGFWSFVDGVKDRGRRLLQAGRDIATLFGPRFSAGLSSAWADLKAGWGRIKSLFEAIAKAADIKFDFSGLSIDNAEVAVIQALEAAMTGLSNAWDALKDFGSGFALHLPDIGDDIGKTIKKIGEIASAIGRLAKEVGRIINLDMGKAGDVFRTLGDLLGTATGWAFDGIRMLAENLSAAAKALADLAEKTPEIDWSTIFGPAWDTAKATISGVKDAISGLVDLVTRLVSAVKSGVEWSKLSTGWETVRDAVDKVASAIESLSKMSIDWSKLLPDSVVKGWTDLSDAVKTIKEFMAGGSLPEHILTKEPPPGTPKDAAPEYKNFFLNRLFGPQQEKPGAMPEIDRLKDSVRPPTRAANQNDKAKPNAKSPADQADQGNLYLKKISDWFSSPRAPGRDKAAPTNKYAPAMAPQRQEVKVGGAITIKVDGPGTVTQTTTANKDVPLTTGKTGRVVGRV